MGEVMFQLYIFPWNHNCEQGGTGSHKTKGARDAICGKEGTQAKLQLPTLVITSVGCLDENDDNEDENDDESMLKRNETR